VVTDSIGSATFQTSLSLLKPGGRLITCGASTGPQLQVMLNQIFWKQLEIKGSTMSNQGEFRTVMKLVFEEKINPIIDKIFALDEAMKAENCLSKGIHFGKVLLEIL
jgi:NADPH:quinone reductase-like Zn-dependent oxidoreductase